MIIRALGESDRPWAAALISEHFGSTRVVSRGVLHDALQLPGLGAVAEGTAVGLVLYRIVQDECEVVVLIAAQPRHGIGRALLEAVRQMAQQAGCARLRLITTNDNHSAQAFYQTQGMRQVAVYRGAITQAREFKPEIPLVGEDGIPIEDEIEYEIVLDRV